MQEGVVKFINETKDFGLITPIGGDKIFSEQSILQLISHSETDMFDKVRNNPLHFVVYLNTTSFAIKIRDFKFF
ncbi:hypothetical protein [Olivibacter sp. XZL3]|uniref:hypothetical protein n=1 Tax=Olivibacter sp. XZL3 TaxID=1735116 RepID=UPI001F0EE2CA|nr:hypothetical protein [Olivibacter sp. XZL3]